MMGKKDLNRSIGLRIKTARERSGLTQEQLAEQINRSTQFISTIERGVAGPSLETIVALCDTLNTTSEWLIRGIEPTPSAYTIAAKLSTLSSSQLLIVDRMVTDLLHLIQNE